ncbi:hypothetical protein Plhal703r1_c55g0160351 [Plasmopara halstedii]
MWLNSRNLSGDDEGGATRDVVWGFTNSTPSPSHGSIGASGSRAIWNRTEPAEEEREEEALPSYLSYLQPAFHSPAVMADTHVSKSSHLSGSLHTTMRNTPELLAPSTKQHALEHLVLNSEQQRLGDGSVIDNQTRCTCNCDVMWEQMEEMTMQILTLQNRSRVMAPVDQATATLLSDRISTLEGRQSAFQSQLAQIAKVLGIPTGKPGKHSPVKHLVQTLRDEVDAKVQQATADLTAKINAEIEKHAACKTGIDGMSDSQSSNVILAALASEHEASLTRLSGSFEELLAEEARQRTALESRVRLQLSQQEEWLQQLEGAFGSPHDPEHGLKHRGKNVESVDLKLKILEQKCDECRDLCQQLIHAIPDVTRSRNLSPGERG